MAAIPDYVELRCRSNFSFLKGASQPEDLVERAKQLGYRARPLTAKCTRPGIARAHVAARAHALPLIVVSQFEVDCAHPFTLVVLACNLNGYGNLCAFITALRRRSEKGTYALRFEEQSGPALEDCGVIASPKRMASPCQLLWRTVAHREGLARSGLV